MAKRKPKTKEDIRALEEKIFAKIDNQLEQLDMLKLSSDMGFAPDRGRPMGVFTGSYCKLSPPKFLPAVQKLIDGFPNKPRIIEYNDGLSSYLRLEDIITVAEADKQWPRVHRRTGLSEIEYRSWVILHELGHSTGETDRLDRDALHDDFHYNLEEIAVSLAATELFKRIGLLDSRYQKWSDSYIEGYANQNANGRTAEQMIALAQPYADQIVAYISGEKVTPIKRMSSIRKIRTKAKAKEVAKELELAFA